MIWSNLEGKFITGWMIPGKPAILRLLKIQVVKSKEEKLKDSGRRVK